MKITALKQQLKNPDRVSIFVDGKYSFSLNLNQVIEEKIKSGLEIDEKSLTKLKKISDEGKVRQKTLNWLLIRPHSSYELRQYLVRKKVEPDFSNHLISEFERLGYLNDAEFAKWWAQNRAAKNYSSKKIAFELKSKGVDASIVDSLTASFRHSEDERLRALINKKRRSASYKDNKKLIAYLLRQGYRYSEIIPAVKQLED